MASAAPARRDVRTLQYWWLGFAGLLLAGRLAVFFRSYDQTGSGREALQDYRSFHHSVAHQLLVFLLLLVVSTTARKAVWWLAVGIIVLKAASLVAYYLTHTLDIQSRFYYSDLSYCCQELHLSVVPGLFFAEPLSLALLGLYGYWLILCWRILRTVE